MSRLGKKNLSIQLFLVLVDFYNEVHVHNFRTQIYI